MYAVLRNRRNQCLAHFWSYLALGLFSAPIIVVKCPQLLASQGDYLPMWIAYMIAAVYFGLYSCSALVSLRLHFRNRKAAGASE
jgi:hypothetical protein